MPFLLVPFLVSFIVVLFIFPSSRPAVRAASRVVPRLVLADRRASRSLAPCLILFRFALPIILLLLAVAHPQCLTMEIELTKTARANRESEP